MFKSCHCYSIQNRIKINHRKKVYTILVITKNEAKKLANMGLKHHKDIFTGRWKRRRYYLREDWEGRNVKLLNKIRNCVIE